MQTISRWLRARLSGGDSDQGASLVEYALLVALIALVCVVAVTALGTTLSDSYDASTSSMFVRP